MERLAVTCVVVDDHPSVVDAVSKSLGVRGVDVVGQGGDAEAALELIETHRPSVALVDVNLPDLSGTEVARRVNRRNLGTPILLFTGQGEAAVLREGIDAGARGFVVKTASLDEVAAAVKAVAAGGMYVDPVLAAELARQELTRDQPDLTTRERDVLRLMAEGMDYTQIGSRLFLSAETVRVAVRTAMAKLDADTRTQAVAEALRQRLIT